MSHSDDSTNTLETLIETCRDGAYGFRACAEHVRLPEIRTVLMQRADECEHSAEELQQLLQQLGGEADAGGTVGGALHRGWVSVRAVLSLATDAAMLDECERGEDAAVARYRKALDAELQPALRPVIERQYDGVQRNRALVRALRDQLHRAA